MYCMYWRAASFEQLGIGVLPLLFVHAGQVGEVCGYIRVIFAERLLRDRKPTFIDCLGLGIFALCSVYKSQVVESLCLRQGGFCLAPSPRSSTRVEAAVQVPRLLEAGDSPFDGASVAAA
jgi:hypothetical protein